MIEVDKPSSFGRHAIFWALTLTAFLLFVWIFNSILLPFVIGMAVAYLLNPMVQVLGKVGFGRQASAIIILFGFTVILVTLLALILPVLYREITELADNLPSIIERVKSFVQPLQMRMQQVLGYSPEEAISAIGQNADGAVGAGKALLTGLIGGGMMLTGIITVLVVAPIVAFFMMQEWPAILSWGRDLLPRHHMDTILMLLKKMDRKLAGFVRGQLTVAVFLGLIYAIALSLAGLKYGFLIGILSGVFSIIPMVGSTLGLVASVGVAYMQSGDIMYVALIAGIFLTGQIVEGNFLTPKLVGDSVGLHPLWVFFALMAGGALFGIVGMLLAVPVAAVLSVIIGFMIERYKDSPFYLGDEPEEMEETDEPVI